MRARFPGAISRASCAYWTAFAPLRFADELFHLRVQRSLLGEIPLNAFRAKEADLRRHHQTLLAHPQITSMMAYVDASVGLAQFNQGVQ